MKTVLLIEDDKNIALALGIRLKAMGYSVETASDAITAVSQARRHSPDVCLLDINLPGGDGFIVAERLHKLVQTATTPIVFITASKKYGLREKAFELGAAGFLEKPFDAKELADTIEMSLHSQNFDSNGNSAQI